MGTIADKLSAIADAKVRTKSVLAYINHTDVGDVLSAYPSKVSEMAAACLFGVITSLTSDVRYITSSRLASCDTLLDVSLPNLSAVDDAGEAFRHCHNLTSVAAPNLQYAGARMCYYCSSMVDLDLPSLTAVGVMAFERCRITGDIDLPNVVEVGQAGYNWCGVYNLPEDGYHRLYAPQITAVGQMAF